MGGTRESFETGWLHGRLAELNNGKGFSVPTSPPTSPWGAVRVATPAGTFYICSTAADAQTLLDDSAARSQPRAVFLRSEIAAALETLRDRSPSDRQTWLADVLAVKLAFPEARVDRVRQL